MVGDHSAGPGQPSSDEPARPAGWYVDPRAAARFRYWDGEQWSVYGSDDGRRTVAVPAEGFEAPGPERIDPRRWLAVLIAMGVLTLMVLTALWGWWTPSDDPFALHGGSAASVGGNRWA